MTSAKFFYALLTVAGISAGQLLLKIAAVHLHNGTAWEVSVAGFRVNAWLVGGIAVLGVSTLVWLSVLRTVPLNYAYPIMALAFVMVPAMSFLVLGEPLTLKLGLGSLLIAAGVVVIYT
ncbi:candidate membrane protein [Ramlibacter tataouinensis TTB310]|uniref:Candidate membrane protein n=2 Tax=Ramlibacter tataouinensis TaxID=94132 RepID=F5XYX3_RAMTT|nr:candidate membrane protein [Ramlibacter tataouinensis TTB310]